MNTARHFTIVTIEDKVQHTVDAPRELIDTGVTANTKMEGGVRVQPPSV